MSHAIPSTDLTPDKLARTLEFDAFAAHQDGIPLASLIYDAHRRGIAVNLAVFACDAYAAGWDDVKLQLTLADAAKQCGVGLSWRNFDKRMAELYKIAGESVLAAGGSDRDAYLAMKKWLIKHWSVKLRAKAFNAMGPKLAKK